MRRNTGSPPLYLVSSTPEPRNPKLVRESIAQLEACRGLLRQGECSETVKLLDIVLLQLRMELLGISEAELKAVCTTMFETTQPTPQRPDRV